MPCKCYRASAIVHAPDPDQHHEAGEAGSSGDVKNGIASGIAKVSELQYPLDCRQASECYHEKPLPPIGDRGKSNRQMESGRTRSSETTTSTSIHHELEAFPDHLPRTANIPNATTANTTSPLLAAFPSTHLNNPPKNGHNGPQKQPKILRNPLVAPLITSVLTSFPWLLRLRCVSPDTRRYFHSHHLGTEDQSKSTQPENTTNQTHNIPRPATPIPLTSQHGPHHATHTSCYFDDCRVNEDHMYEAYCRKLLEYSTSTDETESGVKAPQVAPEDDDPGLEYYLEQLRADPAVPEGMTQQELQRCSVILHELECLTAGTVQMGEKSVYETEDALRNMALQMRSPGLEVAGSAEFPQMRNWSFPSEESMGRGGYEYGNTSPVSPLSATIPGNTDHRVSPLSDFGGGTQLDRTDSQVSSKTTRQSSAAHSIAEFENWFYAWSSTSCGLRDDDDAEITISRKASIQMNSHGFRPQKSLSVRVSAGSLIQAGCNAGIRRVKTLHKSSVRTLRSSKLGRSLADRVGESERRLSSPRGRGSRMSWFSGGMHIQSPISTRSINSPYIPTHPLFWRHGVVGDAGNYLDECAADHNTISNNEVAGTPTNPKKNNTSIETPIMLDYGKYVQYLGSDFEDTSSSVYSDDGDDVTSLGAERTAMCSSPFGANQLQRELHKISLDMLGEIRKKIGGGRESEGI